MGAPGAGKTTWLQANRADQHIASTEQIRVDREIDRGEFMHWMRQRAIQELDSGRSVIADGTHIDRRHRAFWLKLAEVYSTAIHLIVFDTSLELLLAAQRNRTAPVPNNIVRKYFRDFQFALPSIAHEPWDSVETFVRQ